MIDMLSMGRQIRKYRTDKNITQKDLAERLFVSQQAVQKWEKGDSFPQADKLAEIADIFDVSVSNLYIDGDETGRHSIMINISREIMPFQLNLNKKSAKFEYGLLSWYIYDEMSYDIDVVGNVRYTLRLDKMTRDAYRMLKEHNHINDVDFFRMISPDEYRRVISGRHYVEPAIDRYYSEATDPTDVFYIKSNRQEYLDEFVVDVS